MRTACCVPERRIASNGIAPTALSGAVHAPDPEARFVRLVGGAFLTGSDDPVAHPVDGEGPVRRVLVLPFEIDAVAVTNRRFARFAETTGYKTESEAFGWSFVFLGFLNAESQPTQAAAGAPWWRQVLGASWRHPDDPQSTIDDRLNHPVSHISYHDSRVNSRRWYLPRPRTELREGSAGAWTGERCSGSAIQQA